MTTRLLPLLLMLLFACSDGTTVDDSGDCTDCDTGDTETSPSSWDGPTVIINEFMADNATTIAAPSGEYEDWIELYNLSDEAIDLTGWTITDDLDEPDSYELQGVTIPPRGFELLWADDVAGPGHVTFKLGKDGEELGLYDPDGNAHTRLVYDAQATDWSAARMPDGSLTWEIIDDATPGASNGGP